MIIIGIDPGINGGISVYYKTGIEIFKMPETEKDIADLLEEVKEHAEVESEKLCCYIERVSSRPGQGVASTFKFGKSFGILIGTLTALKIPTIEVLPQKWQKYYLLPKADSKTEHKNNLKRVAQGLFPDKKITLATADAILIANYGKNNYNG